MAEEDLGRRSRSAALLYAAAIIAVAALGALVIGFIAQRLHPQPDPRYPVDVYAGLALPMPVFRLSNGAVGLFGLTLAIVALVCWLAFGLARAWHGGRSKSALLLAQLLGLLALCVIPWTITGDVYQFILLGREFGVHGINPYALRAPLPTSDASTAAMLRLWGNPPPLDIYGPLWTLLSALAARVEIGMPLWVDVVTHRIAAAAAAVATSAALLHLLRRRSEVEAARRTAAFAFHPLVMLECAVCAHNDMLMVAPALWAFAVADEYALVAGLLIGVAIVVKIAAAIVLPFVAVKAARRGISHAILGVAVACVVAVLAYLPFWRGSETLISPVAYNASLETSATWLVVAALRSFHAPLQPQAYVAAALFVVLVITAMAVWRFRRTYNVVEVMRSCTALVWAVPMLHPWYAQWLAPGASMKGRWGTYAWWFGVFALALYPLYLLRPPDMPGFNFASVLVGTIIVLFGPPAVALRNAPRRTTMPNTPESNTRNH